MEQIVELKKRIKSISDIKQMTRAMQLISAVKMRKARAALDIAFPFFVVCAETMATLKKKSDVSFNPLMQLRQKGKGEVWNLAVFVFSGDQGMAGAYNLNVLNRAEEFIHRTFLARTDEGKNVRALTYVIGSIGVDRLRHQGLSVDDSQHFPIDPPTYQRAGILSAKIQEMYLSGEVDEIYLIYTKMSKALSMEVMETRVLPVDFAGLSDIYHDYTVFSIQDVADNVHIDYEPDPQKVLDYLTDTYMNGMVYGALNEAYASEQTARMTAMDHATKNAEDILFDLQTKSNQARQAKITEEISEIVGGAEVLAGQDL